ncbi:MAG: hypothetical protein AB7G68_20665 [Nitrospiraceae bacterium]
MTNQANLPEQPVKPLARGQRHAAYLRLPPMAIRTEVRTFCAAAETLLSPVLLQFPLNEEEQGMIRLYLENLQEKILTDACASRAVK